MNKFIALALAAGSLLLLDSAPAVAHDDARDKRSRSGDHYSRYYDRDFKPYRGHRRGYYESRYKRSKHMPRWLKQDRAFRHWYKDTHLRANYRISWNHLFDIYIHEHRFHSHRRY